MDNVVKEVINSDSVGEALVLISKYDITGWDTLLEISTSLANKFNIGKYQVMAEAQVNSLM